MLTLYIYVNSIWSNTDQELLLNSSIIHEQNSKEIHFESMSVYYDTDSWFIKTFDFDFKMMSFLRYSPSPRVCICNS